MRTLSPHIGVRSTISICIPDLKGRRPTTKALWTLSSPKCVGNFASSIWMTLSCSGVRMCCDSSRATVTSQKIVYLRPVGGQAARSARVHLCSSSSIHPMPSPLYSTLISALRAPIQSRQCAFPFEGRPSKTPPACLPPCAARNARLTRAFLIFVPFPLLLALLWHFGIRSPCLRLECNMRWLPRRVGVDRWAAVPVQLI